MTIYYLSSVDGDNGSDGLSWANAFATFKYAVETASAAASGPHIVYVDSAHSESLSGDTTITAAADIRVVCVNRSGGDAPTTGAVVGAQATSYNILLAGAYDWYIYGMTFRVPGSTSGKWVQFNADGSQFELDSCTLDLAVTVQGNFYFGGSAATANQYMVFRNCVFNFASANSSIDQYCNAEYLACSLDAGSTSPTRLFRVLLKEIVLEGCDLSKVTTSIIGSSTAGSSYARLVNCKLGSGAAILEAPATVLNKGNTSATAFNCAIGDTHYQFYHGDGFGETIAVTTYYADDGAQYDGTNRCSWKIVTRANNCSFYTPYVSPWIDAYHSGTSAITPYLEGLRVDSTTVIQDDEVWGEWSFQATSGVPLATFKNDRMALLGTAANQTSSLAYSNWTGSPTDTDSGDSTFKLAAPSATTPAEIGHVRARVCVGEPGLTVYIDPQIRGLS